MPKFAFLLVFYLSSAVFAETAGQMLSACKGVSEAKILDDRIQLPEDIDAGLCWGAFSVIDTVTNVMNPPNRNVIFEVCVPEGVARSQEVAIFVEYAKRNPQRLHENFFFVARDPLKT